MSLTRDAINYRALVSLFLGRIVYAVNWYSLAAVFSFTASELHQNVSGLGLATSMFFVGIGIFQVPGGILAAKVGPRLTALSGTSIASLAVLLTSLAGSLAEIAVLRFFVGLGMALVFSPGVVLITRFLHERSGGFGVGLYNSAFNLGGAVGLFGWAMLATEIGWRNSMAIGGLLGLFTSTMLWFMVPKDNRRADFTIELHRLKGIFLDKWLIVISFAMLSLQLGAAIYTNFMAYYLVTVFRIDVGEAAAIASLSLFFALIAAPFSGRLFDRFGNARKLLLISGVLMALGVGVAFFGTIYSAILSGILVGSASGSGFTFGFSAARVATKLDQEYTSLAISWVNGISLFGNFVPPLLYTYFALQYGYSIAWVFMAVLAFILVVPVLFSEVFVPEHGH